MAFPSELPAMRRQITPPPHPAALACVWAAMSYVTAMALLLVLLPQAVPLHALWSTSMPTPVALGIVMVASLLPALIIGLMVRRAPMAWSVSRVALPYVAMLLLVGGLQAADLQTNWFFDSLMLASR